METMTKAARLEVKILETLQNKRTAVGDKNCIRMVTDFTYRGHTCLVFEPMVRLSALQAIQCMLQMLHCHPLHRSVGTCRCHWLALLGMPVQPQALVLHYAVSHTLVCRH